MPVTLILLTISVVESTLVDGLVGVISVVSVEVVELVIFSLVLIILFILEGDAVES